MATVSLSLFGAVQATLGGQPIESLGNSKVQALLIYIAVEPGIHSRETLIELLWPGMPERSARHNLRQSLYHLRTIIPDPVVDTEPDEDQTIPLILANRQSIELNPAADIQVDVHLFKRLIDGTLNHEHLDLLLCPSCQADLEKAASLYRADFLADFYLEDSSQFEEWAQISRETYRGLVLDALDMLTSIYSSQKAFAEARSSAQRQLKIDNLRESAYRQLMEILALNGRREEALATYEKCRRLLAEELAMAPSKRTTELYEKILAGDLTFDRPSEQGVRGYELIDEIGEGTYGSIRRAVQPTIGREVAIKVIRRKYANDPEFIRRFEAEAQTVARLEHPHIVPLYDYWRDPDGAYLVMRYLRGGSLLSALEGGAWDIQPAVRLLDQVASALSAAHHQGIIHRDIKPANILLDEAGNAYLSDFGIAKDLTGEMQLTGDGAVIGTPDYISPEQILSKGVTPRTDIYSMGAVLYETLTGEKPFPDTTMANLIYRHLNDPVPLVTTSRPGIPSQVDAVIQKATAKNPSDRYANALEMAKAFRQAIAGERSTVSVVGPEILPPSVEVYNPYKGLRAFQEADADDFFGRETLVQQLVGRLADSRFLALVGPSGSGKSSAVKAGLIPALRSGALPGSDKWFVAEMVPGVHPLEELEKALWPIAVDPPPSLVEPLERDSRGLLRTLHRVLPDEPGAQLLLIVDQFEELFTLVEDEERRTFFVDSLLQAIHAPRSPLTVVVTLRADFYDRPLRYETLGKLLKENTEVILPLNSEELAWAMREPARRVGVGLEEGLAEAIVADLADQPGSLPMLQYALTELFERRQNGSRSGLMTQEAYRDIGGVLGALGRRAEEIYTGLDESGQESARQLFLRLVALGEGTEDTRRRVLRSELEAIGEQQLTINNQRLVIDDYGEARLLTFDNDPVTRQPTVEVAHEALLREWKRLRGWLDESRNDVRLQRMLAVAAAEWRAAGQDPGFLLRDARLDQFAGWAETTSIALTGDEQAYLGASLAAQEARLAKEEARRQRELETAQKLAETEHARAEEEQRRAEEQAKAASRLRRRAALLAGALLIAALLAIAAVFFANQANQNEQEALAEADRRATAQAQADEQRNLAVSESESRATAQAAAEANEAEAVAQQATAVAAASLRATAEAQAIKERVEAETQAALATSRELAAAAVINLEEDPERSILLAMQALSITYTTEAEGALHEAVQSSRLRQILRSPGNPSMAWLALNPDGSRLFTSGQGEASGAMWDIDTGNIIFTQTVTIPEDVSRDSITDYWINRSDFNPDGSLLALPNEVWAGEEPVSGFITILNAGTGEEIVNFQAHDEGLQVVSFSPSGAQLASGGLLGSASLWDVPATVASGTGQEISSLCCHGDLVWSISYSPDGSRVVTTSDDETLKVWDATDGTELLNVEVYANDAIFSHDGNYLIVGTFGGDLMVLDAATGERQSLVPGAAGQNFNTLRLSPDGTRLATTAIDRKAKVWEYANGELNANPLVLSGHNELVGGVAFTPDGRYLITGSSDGTARIWDISLDGGSEYGAYAHAIRATDLEFSADGEWLASVSFDGTAIVWDRSAREVMHTLRGHQGWVVGVAIHPDSRTLATASNDGTVRIWDAQTGVEKLVIQAHEVDPNQFFSGAKGISYSADGGRLATGGSDGMVRIWDATTGEMLQEMAGHTGTINVVEYSSDGRWLISAGDDGLIRVWDPDSGHLLWTLPGEPWDPDIPQMWLIGSDLSIIWDATFSPDGSRLVTGHNGGQAVIWLFPDPEAGPDARPEKVLQVQHNPQWVVKSGFSPDNNLLVIAGLTRPTTVHDANTGEQLANLGYVANTAQFSPDGRVIALAGSLNGNVRLYAANVEELMTLAKSRVTRSLTDEECQQYLHLDACPPG